MKPRYATSTGLTAGRPWPLGAHVDESGVNLAVYSAHAQAIEWCVFDPSGTKETARHPLVRSGDVWHAHLAGAGAGLVYGLRAHGPWSPQEGHRFNPHKLLLDPRAREVVGDFQWSDLHFAFDRQHPSRMDHRDNAGLALKARVVDDAFDWGGDRSPQIAPVDTVIYEVHARGYSRLNPRIPQPLRGTYAGLAHAVSIAHLQALGATSLCLLPVHLHLDEERLVAMGLRNHWGYNTLGFFCVEPRYASAVGGQSPRDEFKSMVKALHAAGFEVLLDVVFNHTAESDECGPNLSFRGLDNASYYRLPPESRAHYENHAGCGNTLDIRQPAVLQLVMDSLRHWVTDMHVDGFRFDLAPVLGRGDHGFHRDGAFFGAAAQDPVLSRVKMIAEPWDIGPGGYQVGAFPRGWQEWNDHFRDAMRTFWLRTDIPSNHRATFARRLCASSDLFQQRRRSPLESINYVVSHDGFTLRDLVSYAERHNLANGEGNRDGHGHNLSINAGVEGPSDDLGVNALRGRLQRALLATTLLAQGTPMLAAGDEIGHTQRGNNNPYCQDNEITWIAWDQADADLFAFTARLLELRRNALPFGGDWYSGLTDPFGLHDLTWLRASGDAMDSQSWHDDASRVLGCLIGRPGRARAPLLLLVNGDTTPCDFMLPAGVWQGLLDTAHPRGSSRWHGQGEAPIPVSAHSLMLLAAAGAGVA
ncbi:MAG: glycogen debranching protein GlgX [Rhizobacter sp.]|nr:glycogen debranching protein GlgX [Rhizobacter sp.]